MTEIIKSGWDCLSNRIKADFVAIQSGEVQLVQDSFSAEGQEVAILSDDDVNQSLPAQVGKLGICLIGRHDKFIVLFLELFYQLVGDIRADIDGINHFFESLFLISQTNEFTPFFIVFLSFSED